MNMTVVRYINNEPYRGENLPAIKVDNPGVVMVLKDLQQRLAESPREEQQDAVGRISH